MKKSINLNFNEKDFIVINGDAKELIKELPDKLLIVNLYDGSYVKLFNGKI